jgi:hypothetical protein
MQYPSRNKVLLVAETPVFATIRTGPNDGITRHAPQVFFHTLCTNLETAPASPAEGRGRPTHMALVFFLSSPPSALTVVGFLFHHDTFLPKCSDWQIRSRIDVHSSVWCSVSTES